MMTCCCLNTTTIIINTRNNSKGRENWICLEVNSMNCYFLENKTEISVKSNVKMKQKQNRSVPNYSNIYRLVKIMMFFEILFKCWCYLSTRRKFIEEFTPAPRNNGHAKAFVIKTKLLFHLNIYLSSYFKFSLRNNFV